MKRYLLLSLLLHSLILIPIIKSEIESEITQTENKMKEGFGTAIQIIEFELTTGDVTKELKTFYWGLGISCDEQLREIPGYGRRYSVLVQIVHVGYSGEASGLKSGDIIFEIDGKPVTPNNDIRGEGPSNILLTILKKNGKVIKITVPRVKVYY